MKNNWKLEKLGDICEFINGKGHEKLIDEDGDYIVVNSKFVSSNGKVFKKSKSQLLPLLKNDIVMVMSDVPNGKTIAKCFKIEENNKYTLNQRVCSLRTNKIDIDFLFKQLNRNQYFLEFDNGENQTNLRKNDVLNCPILIPPIEEQQTIVAKLDQAFAAIDQAKANIEKNIANAKELFQSKLNQIFSQKGEGWVEKRVKEIGKVQTGTTPPTKDKDNYGEFIPFIKPAHFNSDGSLTPLDSYLSEKGIKKSRLIEANSVLMVCIGATIGKTGFTEIDVTCNQQINTITPSKNYNYKFIYFGMISKIFQDEVLENGKGAQATLPIINKSKWENLFLNVNPNKDIQNQIVSQLDQLQEQTNLLVTKYQQKLANLEELKKSILEKAFKGELS